MAKINIFENMRSNSVKLHQSLVWASRRLLHLIHCHIAWLSFYSNAADLASALFPCSLFYTSSYIWRVEYHHSAISCTHLWKL